MHSQSSASITRRALMKGAAWAAPAILAASALPLAAASHHGELTPEFAWVTACKSPGNSGKGCGPKSSYQVRVTVTNTTSETQILRFTSFTVDGVPVGLYGMHQLSGSGCGAQIPSVNTCGSTGLGVSVAPGATVDIWLVSGSTNSSGGDVLSVGWAWFAADDCAPGPSGIASGQVSGEQCA